MTKGIARAIARYGLAVTVEHGGTQTGSRALLQPIRRERTEEPFEPTPLGAAERRAWRYLGAADTPIAQGDRVRCGERSFRARRAEAVCAGREIAYHWAVLLPEEDA